MVAAEALGNHLSNVVGNIARDVTGLSPIKIPTWCLVSWIPAVCALTAVAFKFLKPVRQLVGLSPNSLIQCGEEEIEIYGAGMERQLRRAMQ